jgi:hypothetical protein
MTGLVYSGAYFGVYFGVYFGELSVMELSAMELSVTVYFVMGDSPRKTHQTRENDSAKCD